MKKIFFGCLVVIFLMNLVPTVTASVVSDYGMDSTYLKIGEYALGSLRDVSQLASIVSNEGICWSNYQQISFMPIVGNAAAITCLAIDYLGTLEGLYPYYQEFEVWVSRIHNDVRLIPLQCGSW